MTTTAWSQQSIVTGKVTSSDDGSALSGVRVIEKGTNNETVTNSEGIFSIPMDSSATLVFSFSGFNLQEIHVGGQSNIYVKLITDSSNSARVTTGYGTQEKNLLTSAVTRVTAEEFNRGTINDPMQLVQGKVAGLSIVSQGGDPNGNFTVRLRGISSFDADAEPLVVIDGVMGASLSMVDPADIASFDILKDAASAAIFGSRGGKGVMLLTTKSGQAGKIQIEYNGSTA